MGIPVTLRTESAAPPRASPSVLVSIKPGKRHLLVKRLCDTFTASCPVMASATSSTSWGETISATLVNLCHHLRVNLQAPRRIDDDGA